jgi:putative transposase
MPNHVHLVVTPRSQETLSNVIGFSHRVYSSEFNKRHSKTGKLWQRSFYSCPLDKAHFLEALVYVDQNPVRSGMVESPWDFPWSSAVAHCGRMDPARLINLEKWKTISSIYGWNDVVHQRLDENAVSVLRKHTISGRPLGRF